MKIATNIRKINEFGFQLILEESNCILGINLLWGKKILFKHRFEKEFTSNSSMDEKKLVYNLLSLKLSENKYTHQKNRRSTKRKSSNK